MPFPFVLPTTSNLSYPAFVSSSTHPSLPLAASTERAVLRTNLKRHRKLSIQDQPSDLSQITAAVQDYLPYLAALKAGLGDRRVANEEIDIALKNEIAPPWRTTLASSLPSTSTSRAKGKGINFEICFVLNTLAFIYNAQARAQLHTLYGKVTPTSEQRTSLITAATRLLLDANSIHAYLSSHTAETDASAAVVEVLSQTQSGLGALAMAEATLLAVFKDDPYPAVVAQDRNKDDKEWMVKPPDIPKVRAHLFARLCLAAAENAGRAEAMLSASGRVNEHLIRYVSNLRKTSKAKACRFLGINAELGGETSEGIAWLRGAKKQLDLASATHDDSKLKGVANLKRNWMEKREDKKVEKGREWGGDAGKLEELRVIEMLEKKWNKMNDTINTQLIPPSDGLIATLPSGREIHTTKPFQMPELDAGVLMQMRAPPEKAILPDDLYGDDSSDEDEDSRDLLPGSFPQSSNEANASSYY